MGRHILRTIYFNEKNSYKNCIRLSNLKVININWVRLTNLKISAGFPNCPIINSGARYFGSPSWASRTSNSCKERVATMTVNSYS